MKFGHTKEGLRWRLSKESACNAGDPGSIPRSGRSPGEGNGSPLQDTCLENPMHRRAWRAVVHGVTRVGLELVMKPPPLAKKANMPLLSSY